MMAAACNPILVIDSVNSALTSFIQESFKSQLFGTCTRTVRKVIESMCVVYVLEVRGAQCQ